MKKTTIEEFKKITLGEWISFFVFTLIILSLGTVIGFSVGRNHPSADVKDEWLSGIRAEVNLLEQSYNQQTEEYQMDIELRDSIISVLTKDYDPEKPLKVNINFAGHDNK